MESEVGVFCPPLRLSLMVIDSSNPRVFVGRQQHPVDTQPARCLYGALHAADVVMHAGPRPLVRTPRQPSPHRVRVDLRTNDPIPLNVEDATCTRL